MEKIKGLIQKPSLSQAAEQQQQRNGTQAAPEVNETEAARPEKIKGLIQKPSLSQAAAEQQQQRNGTQAAPEVNETEAKRMMERKNMMERTWKKNIVVELYGLNIYNSSDGSKNVYHGDAPREVSQRYRESLNVIEDGTYDGMMIREFERYLDMVRSKEWTTIRNETGADFSIFDFLSAFPELC